MQFVCETTEKFSTMKKFFNRDDLPKIIEYIQTYLTTTYNNDRSCGGCSYCCFGSFSSENDIKWCEHKFANLAEYLKLRAKRIDRYKLDIVIFSLTYEVQSDGVGYQEIKTEIWRFDPNVLELLPQIHICY